MGHHLVCNSNRSHLYKKTSHLVRTPITTTLQPDKMAYYSVAGSYSKSSWPASGFIAQATYDNCAAVGYNCLMAYLQHTDSRQIWREVTSSHKPETVWYQGAYATSAPSTTAGYQSVEAYLQLGAYHFSTPSNLNGLDIGQVKLKYINGGTIRAYQSAAVQSSNNIFWKNASEISIKTFNVNFGVMTTLGHIQHLVQAPYDSVDLASYTAGTPRGARDLWGFTSTNKDGGIPTYVHPQTNSFTMGANTINAARTQLSNNGIWIVPYFNASVSSSTSYLPYYITRTIGYWGCTSLWGLTLEVEFG